MKKFLKRVLQFLLFGFVGLLVLGGVINHCERTAKLDGMTADERRAFLAAEETSASAPKPTPTKMAGGPHPTAGKKPAADADPSKDSTCIELVNVVSAKSIAKELGQPESWVIQNYRINVWSQHSEDGKGTTVGQILPGSHARLIEKRGDDFRVESPLDGSTGWIGSIQTRGTLWEDVNTRAPCRRK